LSLIRLLSSKMMSLTMRSSRGVAAKALPAARANSMVFRAAAASYSDTSGMKAAFKTALPKAIEEIIEVRKTIGNEVLGECTVDQAYGGMRGVSCMIYETSQLDPEEGIRFRGYTIPELQDQLPKAPGGQEPLAEGLIWLLMTGELPTEAQTSALSTELAERSKLPQHVVDMIAAFPKGMHPMTQLSAAILGCQTESEFAKAYRDGVSKKQYVDYWYEDSVTCMAVLPEIAARIYQTTFHDGVTPPYDASIDYGANFARMMGKTGAFEDLMRLYLVIHSDHEGANVSAHTSHLVGSALSDPYLSTSACMNGLAGPLHGLANQEVLRWLKDFSEHLSEEEMSDKAKLSEMCHATLDAGKVIPGYGHAVLRKTDPRYTCQREYALKHLPDDPMFQLVSTMYEIVPDILNGLGKVKNPYPNVDAHSGVLLQYYGVTEEDFYTVMFGVSRALGVLPMGVWARGLNFPLERPKSWTTKGLKAKFADKF